MSKKKHRKSHSPARLPAPVTSEAGQRSAASNASEPAAASSSPAPVGVDHLVKVARQLVAVEGWDDLLVHSSTPLERVEPSERSKAAVYLQRCRVTALRMKAPEAHRLDEKGAPGLKAALDELRRLEPDFHRLPEFGIYLESLGYSAQENLDAFTYLSRACMEKADIRWLRELRDKALRLQDPDDSLSEVSEELRQQLADLSARLGRLETVAKALEFAAAAADLSEQDRLFVQMLQADVFSRTCDPWDYRKAAELIRALPCATLEARRAMPVEPGDPRVEQRMTPDAWAFLWELENISSEGYSALLAEYPATFGVGVADGIRCLVQSFVAEDEAERDRFLVEATELLLAAEDYWSFFCGENLVVATSAGLETLWAGHLGLNLRSASELILRLYERTVDKYGRHQELCVLYGVLHGLESSEVMDGDSDATEIPGLAWLCEQSMAFEMQAACYVPSPALSWCLFVRSLTRHVESQAPTPINYFVQHGEGDIAEAEQALAVLDGLEELAEVRSQMQPQHLKLWQDEVSKVFKNLIKVDDVAVCKRSLDVGRAFRSDLLAKGGAFTLGYLEQAVGESDASLEYYLAWMQEADDVESTVANLKILFNGLTRATPLREAIASLEALTSPKHPKELKALVAHAKGRLKPLEEQDQFERTAVNRWPTVTGPARGVLSALELIKSFGDWEELGRYAGTDGTWAQRHYRKLLDQGMVIETKTGYRLNEHIRPLLAQENKHAVVGRIVRSDGTSAVKPVFNSQREYGIYQVLVQLCPNHLVFPNCSLQSIMSFERIKELVSEDDFGYYLRASVDVVVVSTTTYLPMLAIEVDSVWHDTERQQKNDLKKDRLFAAAGIPFMRLRPVGRPSETTIRGQVAEHLDELVRTLRADLPGFEQARQLIEDLSGAQL